MEYDSRLICQDFQCIYRYEFSFLEPMRGDDFRKSLWSFADTTLS